MVLGKMRKTQKSFNSTLRLKSKKQIAEDKTWIALGDARRVKQMEVRGFHYCEVCYLWGERDTENIFRRLDYHHLDGNRRNNTDENLQVAHREPCHNDYKRS